MSLEEYLGRRDVPIDVKEAILEDLEDHKKMKKALVNAEEKLRCLIEQNVAGIYIKQNNKFSFVNKKLASMLGYKPEEMLKLNSILDIVHPEDRGIVSENMVKRVFGDIKSIHYKFRAVKKNKDVILLEVHGTATQFNGKPGIIAVAIDVSDNISEIEKFRNH